MKKYIDSNVYNESIKRLEKIYREGHRIVVSFSGGKDSGICVELCIQIAKKLGRLPVEVVMRDEEIMLPGTFEYAEKIANRKEVKFYWYIAGQPVLNIFDRVNPYYWCFDKLLTPDQWIRKPPDQAIYIEDQNIENLINIKKFPPDKNKYLIIVIGLRADESQNRRMAIAGMKGPCTRVIKDVRKMFPIYDWQTQDVWKAIKENNWDYNYAYTVMVKYGLSILQMRIAPPFMSIAAIESVKFSYKAFPGWFDKCSKRLGGIYNAALYGRQSVIPMRQLGETWKDCFFRTCIDEALADWIKKRALEIYETQNRRHKRHSNMDFNEKETCRACGRLSNYETLAKVLYNGDPFGMKTKLKPLEPEFFRRGSGTWGGKPTW